MPKFSWTVNKCSLESINKWIWGFDLPRKSGHCLHEEGGKEGGNTCRCHFLPWCVPRQLIWSEQISVQAQEERADRVSCWFQAASLGFLLKKWSVWNVRSAPLLSASESKGLKEVGGWDCVPIARGFRVIFFFLRVRPLRNLALDVHIASV